MPASPSSKTTIRLSRESDAEAFLRLCHALDAETEFMLLEAHERRSTPEEVRAHLRWIDAGENRVLFVAEQAGQLVGYLEAVGGLYRRNRHAVQIVTGILQACSGQGLGTEFFTHLESWAQRQGVHRLELTVMSHNARALGLYQKVGFLVEGTRRDSLRLETGYVDEYFMAKLLP